MTAALPKIRRLEAGFNHDMASPVLIAQPITHHAAAIFFAVLLVGGSLFVTGPKFARQETVRGEVVASKGFTVISSTTDGSVMEIERPVGSVIRKGELIARVRLPRSVVKGQDTARESVKDVKLALGLLDQQIVELESRLASLGRTRPGIEAMIQRSRKALVAQRMLSSDAVDLVAQRRAKMAPLMEKGFVSQSTFEQLQGTEIEVRQEQRSIDMQLAQLEKDAAEQHLSMSEDERSSRVSLADMRQRRLELEAQLQSAMAADVVEVRSPRNGILSAVRVRPNQTVTSGQMLFAVSQPSAELSIALDVPSTAIGLVKQGQRVNLKFDAFPYETYGMYSGTLTGVDQASVQAAASEPADADHPRLFGADVRPDHTYVIAEGHQVPLRIGMQLTADVTVERRTLLQWWLEPLYALRGTAS